MAVDIDPKYVSRVADIVTKMEAERTPDMADGPKERMHIYKVVNLVAEWVQHQIHLTYHLAEKEGVSAITVFESLQDEPEKVNTDPYGDGWMLRLKLSNRGEVDSLLSAAEYEDYIGSLE